MRKPYRVATALAFAGVFALPLLRTDAHSAGRQNAAENAQRMVEEGRRTFRFDTFGDEDYWGGELRLHEAIAGSRLGGVGAGVSPKAALSLGLKVDAAALSPDVVDALRRGKVNLDDPASTLALLRANAVLGLTGFFDGSRLRSIGIQCALCHSTVDDSFAPGIGRRLDGWANRDLNVGAIVAAAPNLEPAARVLGVSEAAVRKVLLSWGPGKFDASVFVDGKGFRPDGRTAATLIPPAFGLAGVNLHTWTGWGSVPHWNAFVANIEMHGKGTFLDSRLDDPNQFPVAARNGFGAIRNDPDLITSKLPALQVYQLALAAPKSPHPAGADAKRGQALFDGRAKCATCHVKPLFTEPGWNMHSPAELCVDDFQARRSTGYYRTAPLAGLFSHQKGGFYHDGRFATLDEVVMHYDGCMNLGLTAEERKDLVAYLLTL